MVSVEQLEQQGFQAIRPHPGFRDSVLMMKELDDAVAESDIQST